MFLQYFHVCEYFYISYVLSKNLKIKIHKTTNIYVVLYVDGAFITCSYQKSLRDQVKQDEIGVTYSMQGGQEKCMQDFSWEI
jgi:hypothetical protein